VPEQLVGEIRKLEKRLSDYIAVGEEALTTLRELRKTIEELHKLNELIDKSKASNCNAKQILELKSEIIKRIAAAFEELHRVDHTKGHFIENMISLIAEMEKHVKNAITELISTHIKD